MKIFFIFIPLFVMIMGCSEKFSDDKLTLIRQEYKGHELNIDGFYYQYSHSNKNTEYYSIYFLYRNGIIIYFTTASKSTLDDMPSFIEKHFNLIQKNKDCYGIFLIEDSSIKFEKWYPANLGQGLPVYIREGKILNDTTFHITVSYRPDGSERREKDEVYHFKQFSPKPDSTNNFIK